MKRYPFCSASSSMNICHSTYISPLHSAYIQKFIEIFKFPMLAEKRASPFVNVWGGLVTSQKYLYLCRALIFFFVLVHTGVIQVMNWCTITFTMKKHHFVWTSVLNCLTGLLSVFDFRFAIFCPFVQHSINKQ